MQPLNEHFCDRKSGAISVRFGGSFRVLIDNGKRIWQEKVDNLNLN